MAKTAEAIQAEIEFHQARIAELKAQLPKQSRRLTAKLCREVRHSGRRGADRHTAGAGGHGLALVVKQSGAKYFTQRLTLGGRRTDAGLGPYPEVTLDEARDAAFENRRIVRAGGGLDDLVRPGAPPRKPRKAPGVPTLEAAAATVIDIQAKGWRKGGRTREAWESNLRRFAFPSLGGMAVSRIGAPDLLAVVEPFWGTKRRPMNDLLNRLSLVFRWAMAQGHRTDDPVPSVRAALPRNGRRGGHFAALPHAEVGGALAAVRKDGTRPAALALQLAILTACRSGEARGAAWDEIDLQAKTWTIPGGRMKAGAEHVIPLSSQAVAVFEEARALGGERRVFPAPRGGELWDSGLIQVLRGAGFEEATVHGMRSAFRDWAAENDVDRHLAEAALAHSVGGVEGAYLRTKRIEERRAVMQRWADYLTRPQGETTPRKRTCSSTLDLPDTLRGLEEPRSPGLPTGGDRPRAFREAPVSPASFRVRPGRRRARARAPRAGASRLPIAMPPLGTAARPCFGHRGHPEKKALPLGRGRAFAKDGRDRPEVRT